MIIEGDRHWVLAAIENVIRNALKHTPNGSTVTVELVRSKQKELPGDHAELRVTDTGRGLAEAELERIFEPFYRAASAGSSAESLMSDAHLPMHTAGYGLGLAIAARPNQTRHRTTCTTRRKCAKHRQQNRC